MTNNGTAPYDPAYPKDKGPAALVATLCFLAFVVCIAIVAALDYLGWIPNHTPPGVTRIVAPISVDRDIHIQKGLEGR